MGTVYLATNFITATETAIFPDFVQNSGHLQLVYEDDAGFLTEIEVQMPFGLPPSQWAALGNWEFFTDGT